MRGPTWASLLFLGLVAAPIQGQGSEPRIIQACDRVLVQVDDPGEMELGERVSAGVCRALERFEKLFERRLAGRIKVRITADMEAWKAVSGRAWFIAGILQGDRIILQPGRSLRKLAEPVRPAVHELAHRFIRLAAGRGCPRWLDEGLAQRLSGDLTSAAQAPDDQKGLTELEHRLTSPDVDRRQRDQDYAAARTLVGRLVARVGLPELIRALTQIRSASDPMAVQVREGSLSSLLFDPGEPVDGPLER